MSKTADVKHDIQQLYRKLLKQLGLNARWGQKQMIATVANHFLAIKMDAEGQRKGDNPACIVEAGTGTGKTLAYMVACLPIAQALEKKLVIATGTIALQEQIVEKDLPAINTAAMILIFSWLKAAGVMCVCLDLIKPCHRMPL